MSKTDLKIAESYVGKVVYCAAPDYKRKDGGKFVLDDKLSEKDLKYLKSVVKHEAILEVKSKPSE